MDDFYEILGLKPGASQAEIKKAYRQMAKVWHPDRFPNDPELQKTATERLKKINEAYNRLNGARSSRDQSDRSSPRTASNIFGALSDMRIPRSIYWVILMWLGFVLFRNLAAFFNNRQLSPPIIPPQTISSEAELFLPPIPVATADAGKPYDLVLAPGANRIIGLPEYLGDSEEEWTFFWFNVFDYTYQCNGNTQCRSNLRNRVNALLATRPESEKRHARNTLNRLVKEIGAGRHKSG